MTGQEQKRAHYINAYRNTYKSEPSEYDLAAIDARVKAETPKPVVAKSATTQKPTARLSPMPTIPTKVRVVNADTPIAFTAPKKPTGPPVYAHAPVTKQARDIAQRSPVGRFVQGAGRFINQQIQDIPKTRAYLNMLAEEAGYRGKMPGEVIAQLGRPKPTPEQDRAKRRAAFDARTKILEDPTYRESYERTKGLGEFIGGAAIGGAIAPKLTTGLISVMGVTGAAQGFKEQGIGYALDNPVELATQLLMAGSPLLHARVARVKADVNIPVKSTPDVNVPVGAKPAPVRPAEVLVDPNVSIAPAPVRVEATKGMGVKKTRSKPASTEVTADKPKPVEQPVVEEPARDLNAVLKDPTTGKPLHEMTGPELDELYRRTKASEASIDEEVLGVDGAKRYQSLRRRSESPLDDGSAQAELDAIEAALTPQQRDRLGGIGLDDSVPNLEDVAHYRQKVNGIGAGTAEDIGTDLAYAMHDVDLSIPVEQMTSSQRVALAQVLEAGRMARESGADISEVIRVALRKSASRWSDPADAELMLGKLLGLEEGQDLGAAIDRFADSRKPQTALPEPAPVAPAGEPAVSADAPVGAVPPVEVERPAATGQPASERYRHGEYDPANYLSPEEIARWNALDAERQSLPYQNISTFPDGRWRVHYNKRTRAGVVPKSRLATKKEVADYKRRLELDAEADAIAGKGLDAYSDDKYPVTAPVEPAPPAPAGALVGATPTVGKPVVPPSPTATAGTSKKPSTRKPVELVPWDVEVSYELTLPGRKPTRTTKIVSVNAKTQKGAIKAVVDSGVNPQNIVSALKSSRKEPKPAAVRVKAEAPANTITVKGKVIKLTEADQIRLARIREGSPGYTDAQYADYLGEQRRLDAIEIPDTELATDASMALDVPEPVVGGVGGAPAEYVKNADGSYVMAGDGIYKVRFTQGARAGKEGKTPVKPGTTSIDAKRAARSADPRPDITNETEPPPVETSMEQAGLEPAKVRGTDAAKRAEIRQRRAEALDDLGKELGTANMGVNPSLYPKLARVIKTYIDEGILDFKIMARELREKFPDKLKGLKSTDLEKVWKAHGHDASTGAKVRVAASKPVTTKSTEQRFSNKNAVTDEMREYIEAPERQPQERQNLQAALDEAKADPKTYVDGSPEILKGAAETGRNLTPQETFGANIKAAQLIAEHDKLTAEAARLKKAGDSVGADRVLKQREGIDSQLSDMTDNLVSIGSDWGLYGRTRQVEMADDYSFTGLLKRGRKAKGDKLTGDETAVLSDSAQELKAAQDLLEEARSKSAGTIEELTKQRDALQKELDEARAKATENRKSTATARRAAVGKSKEAIHLRRTQAVADFRKFISNPHDVTSIPIEASYHLGRIAKTFLDEGVVTMGDLVARVQEALPEFNITKEQVMAGLSEKNPNPKARTPIDPRVAELLRVARMETRLTELKRQLETGDLKEGKPRPAKSDEVVGLEIAINRKRRMINAQLQAMEPKKGGVLGVAGRAVEATSSTMRSLMTPGDVSPLMRQGLILESRLLFTRPRQMVSIMGRSVKAMFSSMTDEMIYNELITDSRYASYERAGGTLYEPGGSIGDFYQKSAAVRIPVAGAVVKAGERNMRTIVNLLQTDYFYHFTETHPGLPLAEQKACIDFTRVAAGEGNLGVLAPAGKVLNVFVFSAKYAASRLEVPFKPLQYWAQGNNVMALESAKTLGSTAAAIGSILTLAKLGGNDVGIDPRNSETFGKIIVPQGKVGTAMAALASQIGFGVATYNGKVHIDVCGGLLPATRLGVRAVLGSLDAHGVKGVKPERFNVKGEAANLMYYKMGPLISLAYALSYKKDIVGQPTTPAKAVARTVTPMGAWDIYESTNKGKEPTTTRRRVRAGR